jgi:hypothetical protein
MWDPMGFEEVLRIRQSQGRKKFSPLGGSLLLRKLRLCASALRLRIGVNESSTDLMIAS